MVGEYGMKSDKQGYTVIFIFFFIVGKLTNCEDSLPCK